MEEDRTLYPVPQDNTDQGVVRYLRDAPPAHYLLKIESFSSLVSAGLEKCESAVFDASGYKWRLVLYPNGNTKRRCGGHISLYLAIETDSLTLGWEAFVTYKMFVFNQDKDKYLTIQDDLVHQIRRFHEMKKESGFDRLISLDTFNAARNGYLLDDSCVFGIEVHEVKYTGNGETFKMIEDPKEVIFDWKICDFSNICTGKLNEKIVSEIFTGGESKWQLNLYPNGDSTKDSLALFLNLIESPASGKKVLAEFWLVIKNQKTNSHRQKAGGDSWFSTNTKQLRSEVSRTWGWSSFMLLSDLKSESSGFILNDTVLVQTRVKIKTEVTSFS